MIIVSQNSVFNYMQNDVNRAQVGAFKAQRTVTTGRRVNDASDDPIAATRGTLTGANVASINAMERVAKVAQSQIETAESVIAECAELLQKAAELAINAANGNLNADNRTAIGQEVAVIQDFLVSAANAQQAGTYLFNGLANAAPFAADGTYSGNSGTRSVPIAFGLTTVVNLPGNQIFNVAGGQNIIGDLATFVTALDNNDQQGCKDAIGRTALGIDQLNRARSTLAASLIKIQEGEQKRGDDMLLLRKERSESIEADQASALVTMTQMNNGLDTTLAASARIIDQMNRNPLLR